MYPVDIIHQSSLRRHFKTSERYGRQKVGAWTRPERSLTETLGGKTRQKRSQKTSESGSPSSRINSVNTPGSLSIRHHPAVSDIVAHRNRARWIRQPPSVRLVRVGAAMDLQQFLTLYAGNGVARNDLVDGRTSFIQQSTNETLEHVRVFNNPMTPTQTR